MPPVLGQTPRRLSDAFLYASFAYTMGTLVPRDPKLDTFPLPEDAKPSRKGSKHHYEHMYGII